MAITLDATTQAEYLAQTLAASRATLIRDALTSPVLVRVYRSQQAGPQLMGSGTMADPWCSVSGATLTIGEVNSSGFAVSEAGIPDGSWYLQFEGANGRTVRGGFGLSGSGADFTWSLASFATGSKGSIGTATITAGGSQGTAPTAASPTGRNPLLGWSGEQQYVWNRMRDENHWFYASMKTAADQTGTASERYADQGQFCAFVYQCTGIASYATKAYNKLFAGSPPTSYATNDTRESFTRRVVWFDWIYPALTQAQRTNGMAHLLQHVRSALGELAGSQGTAILDTDVVHGHLGGLTAMHYYNVPENTRYLNILNQSVVTQYFTHPVGGIDATGQNFSSLRNAAELYQAQYCAGGIWLESSEYNPGTLQLAAMLYEMARNAGTGKYANLLTVLRDAARASFYIFTNGYNDKLYWGDDENARTFNSRVWEDWEGLAAMPAYALEAGDATASALCQRVLQDLYTKFGTAISGYPQFISDAMFKYNPYLPAAATLPTGLTAHYAPGMGMLHVRGPNSHFFATGYRFAFGDPQTLDHAPEMGTDWQLYRGNGWAVTRPIVYNGQSALAANGVVFGNSAFSPVTRDVVRQEQGADWWSLTWACSGTVGSVNVSSWERRIVYLQVGGLDCVVVRDVATTSGGSAPVKKSVLHANVAPTLDSGGWSWTAQNGEQVRVRTLLPASITRSVVTETLSSFGGYPVASEIKFHVAWSDAAETATTTFLSVVFAGNGTLPTVSNSGSTSVTIGSRTITFNASSITVT